MNPIPPEDTFQNRSSDSDSEGCVNIILDLEGDLTVRPMSPESRARLLAERERHARLREQMRAEEAQDPPPPPGDTP
jgi:hypothetical protein